MLQTTFELHDFKISGKDPNERVITMTLKVGETSFYMLENTGHEGKFNYRNSIKASPNVCKSSSKEIEEYIFAHTKP